MRKPDALHNCEGQAMRRCLTGSDQLYSLPRATPSRMQCSCAACASGRTAVTHVPFAVTQLLLAERLWSKVRLTARLRRVPCARCCEALAPAPAALALRCGVVARSDCRTHGYAQRWQPVASTDTPGRQSRRWVS